MSSPRSMRSGWPTPSSVRAEGAIVTEADSTAELNAGQRPGRREFIVLVSAMMALTALAIDMMLPAFDEMRAEFDLADDALLVTPPAKPPRGEDTPCAGRTPDSALSQGKTVARVVAGARVLDLEFAVQQHILRHFQRDEAELLGSVVLDWHGVCRRARALWRCRIAAVSRRVRRLAGMAMNALQDYTVHKRLQKHAGQSLELSRILCKTKIVCPWHQVWQHCSWRRSAVRAVKVGRHHGLRDSPDTFPHSATHGILWLGGLLQRAHVEET